MNNYEYDDRAAPLDKRSILVNGDRYFHKTSIECATCNHPDRALYVKQKVGDDWMCECPVCKTMTPLKRSHVEGLILNKD